MELIAFLVLTVAAVASAVVVVAHRNPVVSAFALAVNLVTIAGFYLLLSAQFIAMLQVLVYAGAIMVLILFVIMLLNLGPDARGAFAAGVIQRLLAPALAMVLLGIIGLAMVRTGGEPLSPAPAGFGTVSSVGLELFGRFFYPFEVISLLLVVAMVGAVLLAKRRI